MTHCDFCGNKIPPGPPQASGKKYCSAQCKQNANQLRYLAKLKELGRRRNSIIKSI